MPAKVDWRRAWIWLFLLSAAATFLSFPFPPPPLRLALALVVIALIVAAGLFCGSRHSLGSARVSFRRAGMSGLIGAGVGAFVLAVLPLTDLHTRIIDEAAIPLWKRFIIAFDSSILEEVIFRLFVMSVIVWLGSFVVSRKVAIACAFVVSALAFGGAHLPRWLALGATPAMIASVMVVNAVAAIVFGVLYMKWGIEAAILSHFAADVAVHVIGPYLFV